MPHVAVSHAVDTRQPSLLDTCSSRDPRVDRSPSFTTAFPKSQTIFNVTPNNKDQRREKIMEKRMFQLGVRRRRPINSIKKKLLNSLLDYLTYDSYMFAPLVSRPPFAFSSCSRQKASVRGREVRKPVREKKKLLKNVSDYLKSNCYMYAPLLAPTRSRIRPPEGPSVYLERVTTFEVSKRKVILGRGYKPNENLADVILNDQTSKGSAEQKGTVKQKDTMKHMVQNSCRASSLPGVGCVLWPGERNAGLPDKEAYCRTNR